MNTTKVSTPKLVIGIVAIILAVAALVYSFTPNAAICGKWQQETYGRTVEYNFSPVGTITANLSGTDQSSTVKYSISGDEIVLSTDENMIKGTYKIVDDTLYIYDGYNTEVFSRDGIAYMQVFSWVASGLLIVLAVVLLIGCKKRVPSGAVHTPYTTPYAPAQPVAPVAPATPYAPAAQPAAPVAPAAPYAPAAQPAAPVAPATPYAPAAQPAAPVAPAAPYAPAAQPAAPVAPATPYEPAAQPAAPATAEGIVSTFKPSGTTTESDNGGSEFFSSGADL